MLPSRRKNGREPRPDNPQGNTDRQAANVPAGISAQAWPSFTVGPGENQCCCNVNISPSKTSVGGRISVSSPAEGVKVNSPKMIRPLEM